jgi:hypothetical protein
MDKIDGLMAGLSRNDIERMSPVARQRLAQALRRVANLCDPPPPPPAQRSGVLAALKDGERQP